MLAGDMSFLMDLRRRANVFCSYAKGFTQFCISFSMNYLYLPSSLLSFSFSVRISRVLDLMMYLRNYLFINRDWRKLFI